MHTRQLEIFIQIAELSSFSKAADVMQVSQSQLSRQVRALEQEIGKHLLYRNGRGVTLTEAGTLFLAQGRGIIRQFETAKQAVSEVHGLPAGKVVVGMPPRVAASLAVPLVVGFCKKLPNATISITEGPTALIHEWLVTGRVDVGMLNNPPLTPQLHYEHVQSADVLMLGSYGQAKPLPSKIRLKDLARFPLILPCRPNAIRNLVDEVCGKRGVTLDIAFEIDPLPAIIDLVRRGLGFALLARDTIPDSLGAIGVASAEIISPKIVSHKYVATSAHRQTSALVRHTVDLIRGEFRSADD